MAFHFDPRFADPELSCFLHDLLLAGHVGVPFAPAVEQDVLAGGGVADDEDCGAGAVFGSLAEPARVHQHHYVHLVLVEGYFGSGGVDVAYGSWVEPCIGLEPVGLEHRYGVGGWDVEEVGRKEYRVFRLQPEHFVFAVLFRPAPLAFFPHAAFQHHQVPEALYRQGLFPSVLYRDGEEPLFGV